MSQKYYIDTCIWRDYYENRSDKFRPLGDWAFELLKHIKKNKDLIVYSNFVNEELLTRYGEEEIKKVLDIIDKRGILIRINENDKQINEAKKLARKFSIPRGDALHAILARDNNAILISRDIHFNELQNIVNIKKPEDII